MLKKGIYYNVITQIAEAVTAVFFEVAWWVAGSNWNKTNLKHENCAFRFHRQNLEKFLVPQKRMCFELCPATKCTVLE